MALPAPGESWAGIQTRKKRHGILVNSLGTLLPWGYKYGGSKNAKPVEGPKKFELLQSSIELQVRVHPGIPPGAMEPGVGAPWVFLVAPAWGWVRGRLVAAGWRIGQLRKQLPWRLRLLLLRAVGQLGGTLLSYASIL